MDTLPFVKWTKRQGVRLFSSVGRKTKMQTKKCLHFGEEERRNRWEMAFWIKKPSRTSAVRDDVVTRRRFELRTPCLKGTRQGASPLDVPPLLENIGVFGIWMFLSASSNTLPSIYWHYIIWPVHETRCFNIFVQPLTSSIIQQQVRASFMRSASSFYHPRAKENMKTSTTLPLYGRVVVL